MDEEGEWVPLSCVVLLYTEKPGKLSANQQAIYTIQAKEEEEQSRTDRARSEKVATNYD